MSKTEWYDVIEALQERMCVNCPHWGGICMPDFNKEGDNYEQMINCISVIEKRVNGEYPNAEDVIPFEE